MSIYTDGSKNDLGVGFAVVTKEQVIHRCLPSNSSVYIAELGTISIILSKIPYQAHKKYVLQFIQTQRARCRLLVPSIWITLAYLIYMKLFIF